MAGTMGRSGRPPKPTAQKKLAGNPGKRALNKNEPDFTLLKGVEPPDYLDDIAQEMWKLVSKELCGQGILCITDLTVLERFCAAYGIWRSAYEGVKKEGTTVMGATGGPVKNPDLTAMKEQHGTMMQTGALLGLDPSSRQRLIGMAGKNQKNDNPFANLVG